MDILRDILPQYPALTVRNIQALGNHGGFSGATIIRLHCEQGNYALKVWPAERSRRDMLEIHGFMTHATMAGLEFVPRLVRNRLGNTLLKAGKSFIEISTWQPGVADFHANPTEAHLRAACVALARLHKAWRGGPSTQEPCPGILRRLDALRVWEVQQQRGLGESAALPAPLCNVLAHGKDIIRRWLGPTWECLQRWLAVTVQTQLCLCDIWHDHVLFTGEEVSGIIDYGSAKRDHVAVDLARLVGSFLGDDSIRQGIALAAYHEVIPLTAWERELVNVLDRTGVVVALCNWLRWLSGGKRCQNPVAVAERLRCLVRRVERWRSLLEEPGFK